MVLISCATKFHSFNLAEQLVKHSYLKKFYTLYYSRRNKFFNSFHKRIDNESIPTETVKTFPIYLPIFFLWKNEFRRSDIYDWLVKEQLKRNKDYKVFIGWSGMSLRSAVQAKRDGKIVLIERGSSHILKQDELLRQEYRNFDINFSVDKRFIAKELKEYDIADYIVIPSDFVRQTFIEKGISEEKLFKNPYGVSSYFRKVENKRNDNTFRILYLGALTIRKGLKYLFDALKQLELKLNNIEVLFVGSVNKEIIQLSKTYNSSNWNFLGHVNHYELSNYISTCDVAVQPSVEEGLSMVIPQIMACGIPIIATTNTGAAEILEEGKTGFIIPIRDSEAIKNKLLELFENRSLLNSLKNNCSNLNLDVLSWDAYGKRYAQFLNRILKS